MNIDLNNVTKIIYNNQEITQLNDSNGNKLWPREAQWTTIYDDPDGRLIGPNSDFNYSYDSRYGIMSVSGAMVKFPMDSISLDPSKTYEWNIEYTVMTGLNRLTNPTATIDNRNNFVIANPTNLNIILTLFQQSPYTYATDFPQINFYYWPGNDISPDREIRVSISYVGQSVSGNYRKIQGIQIKLTKIQVREKS